MTEVFGKKPVSSREFPVLLFGALDTLFHYSPSLESLIINQLEVRGLQKSEAEMDAARLRVIRRLNTESEASSNYHLQLERVLSLWLEELQVHSEDLFGSLQSALQSSTKVVLAQAVIQVLEQLRDRGYRLGVLSTWRMPVADLLRLYGILDLFEVVIEADDAAGHDSMNLFSVALEEFDITPQEVVMIGHSFAGDIVGALHVGIQPVLYDPQFKEVRALNTEDTSQKIVALDALRHNRRLQGTKVIVKFEDLLGLFT